MSEKQIKVTDRRMFTADGRLREAYQHLEEAAVAGAAVSLAPAPAAEPEPPPSQDAKPQTPQEAPLSQHPPTMFELISLIAEPAAVYLQQSRFPGQSAENLELALLHIDLLGLIKQKTAGNLSPREQMALDDTLRQLRALYLESRS